MTRKKFPLKLHEMLEQAERQGFDHIISWQSAAEADSHYKDSFKIHCIQGFEDTVLPTFFGTCQWKSFQRNLNLWGFRAIPQNRHAGKKKNTRSKGHNNTTPSNQAEYFHAHFQRKNPQECSKIARIISSNRLWKKKLQEEYEAKASSSPHSVPSSIFLLKKMARVNARNDIKRHHVPAKDEMTISSSSTTAEQGNTYDGVISSKAASGRRPSLPQPSTPTAVSIPPRQYHRVIDLPCLHRALRLQ